MEPKDFRTPPSASLELTRIPLAFFDLTAEGMGIAILVAILLRSPMFYGDVGARLVFLSVAILGYIPLCAIQLRIVKIGPRDWRLRILPPNRAVLLSKYYCNHSKRNRGAECFPIRWGNGTSNDGDRGTDSEGVRANLAARLAAARDGQSPFFLRTRYFHFILVSLSSQFAVDAFEPGS